MTKGYNQIQGLDYNETFALVTKFATVKFLFIAVAIKGWELHQLDVNNALLIGDLEEEVFMKIPLEVENHDKGMVCKLNKSLYRLQ